MKITKIEIKNFYSIKNLTLDFTEYQGITLIDGRNKDLGGSNGSGKSSIFEGIVWGLFGKTIRKSNEEAVVNSDAKKNCSVNVCFQSGNNIGCITRTRRPTSLNFIWNGENISEESATETQFKIEKYLNTNYKIFLASMLFGQNNEFDFISATPEDKRSIIKNFLNLEEVFNKRDKIKEKKLTVGNRLKSLGDLLAARTEDEEKILKEMGLISKGKDAFLKANNIDPSAIAGVTLDSILKAESELNTLKDLQYKVKCRMEDLSHSMAILRDKIKLGVYTHSIPCPHCKQDMQESQTIEDIKFLKEKESTEFSEWDACRIRYDIINKSIQDLKIPISSREFSKVLEWNKLEDKLSYLVESLENTKQQINKLSQEKSTLSRQHEILKFWEIAFSENGLVQYVIHNIIDYFNEKCNYYLSFLTRSHYYVEFDDKLNEEVFINGKKTHFISLSGGEKVKLNIAILLALQSLLNLTDKDQSDILFFDEFGQFLDRESLDGLYILLQELKKNKNLYIITHNQDLKNLLDGCKTINIEKRKGETKLV